MFEKYPFLKRRTIQDRIDGGTFEYESHLGWLAGDDGKGTLMESRSGVWFSEQYFKNYENALKQATESALDGFTVMGDGTIRTSIRHEYGHEVFSYIKEQCLEKNGNYDAVWDDVRTIAGKNLTGVSEYANVTLEEFAAEGFAAYTSGDDTEFAKAFGAFLGRWLPK